MQNSLFLFEVLIEWLLSAETFQEMTEWLNCLQLVAFGSHSNGSGSAIANPSLDAFNSNNNSSNNVMSMSAVNNLSESQSEENLLYSSVDAPDIYRVKLVETDASVRCGLKSSAESYYTLIVTAVNIALAENGKMLFTWPFRHIRRYGCTKDGFSLEAGRKCTSGEGLFSFITKDGNFIFQAVATHVNNLKASRNLTDDAVNVFNDNSHIKSGESPSLQTRSYFKNETLPNPPSTSPPTLSGMFSMESSLRMPEPSKRHSIQPPKSPEIVPKMALTRVTSVSTSTTTSNSQSNNEMTHITTQRPSPPISKPPRKSKESKPSLELNEPLFASREEVLGLSSHLNNYDSPSPYAMPYKDDEVLYDEPGEIIDSKTSDKEELATKAPFCPSPPPVTHTVSKLTSVLKSMFTGNASNQVHHKQRDKQRMHSSLRSSSTSSANSTQHSSNELAYAQVCLVDNNNKLNIADELEDNTHKILNNEQITHSRSDHEYANVERNATQSQTNDKVSHPQHYVQNDCEYARVVKRTIMQN